MHIGTKKRFLQGKTKLENVILRSLPISIQKSASILNTECTMESVSDIKNIHVKSEKT